MKSDFKKSRRYGRLSLAFVILAAAAFVACQVFLEPAALGAAIGITLFVVICFGAAVFEWAAYDNMLCPKCGHHVVKPQRNSFDKENSARWRALLKRQTVVCAHCGAKVETK